MIPLSVRSRRRSRSVGLSPAGLRPLPYLLAFWCAAALSACYQPKEGCLDPRAANYDVSADDDCLAACCTYPALRLSFRHRYARLGDAQAEETLRYDSLYPALPDTTQLFSVRRARFLFTELQLVREDGVAVALSDSLELMSANGVPMIVGGGFVPADRDLFQAATAGTWVGEGVYTHLRLTIGLPSGLRDLKPEDWPAGHPLRVDSLLYDPDAGFLALRMVLRRDTVAGTPLTDIRLVGPQAVDLPFEAPLRVDNGFDVGAVLMIRYDQLLDGVDFAGDSEAQIGQKMDANLTKAVTVVDIKME